MVLFGKKLICWKKKCYSLGSIEAVARRASVKRDCGSSPVRISTNSNQKKCVRKQDFRGYNFLSDESIFIININM